MAGSEADARAVAWATAQFKAQGFDKVWTEPVTFPKWERRSEHAQVLGANAQPLRVTALGGSPAGTVEAEVVRFADLAALQAAPAGSLRGKIAFVDYQMLRTRDGKDYRQRRRGARQGPVGGDSQGRDRLRDALGRHRFAPRAAYRHHPFRRRPDSGAGGCAVGARRQPAGAAGRTRPGAAASGAGLRLGTARPPRTT